MDGCVCVGRAYPFLVRLHCLRELEKSTALAGLKSESAKLALLQQWNWDNRLTMGMPTLRYGEGCSVVGSVGQQTLWSSALVI